MSLAALAWAAAPGLAWSEPIDCPPMCDRIPASAWIASSDVPLNREYRWPGLAGLAVTTTSPRFRFEEDCGLPLLPGDSREYAVTARAAVSQPEGQWQLQVQVMHWRGETWRGGETAMSAVSVAAGALRACQLTRPGSSPSITTDEPGRLAAVITFGGERVLRQYLLADPDNSTVVELAMWSTTPPAVAWPTVADSQVLDAMARPLCSAYVGSCR
ncbi:ATPase [Mycolicibacterium wolinskyi]|nr:ATPase [Mycolicibacterium wolinskyi]